MTTKARYATVTTAEPRTTSIVGYKVIADNNNGDGSRKLVLERPEQTVVARKRTRKPATAATVQAVGEVQG